MTEQFFFSRVKSILRDNIYDRIIPRKKTGKLSSSGFHRYKTNGRVFEHKQERENKHYNIVILCDVSGSMGYGMRGNGNRIKEASTVVKKLGLALEQGGANVGVYGYNCILHKLKDLDAKGGWQIIEKKLIALAICKDDDENNIYPTGIDLPVNEVFTFRKDDKKCVITIRDRKHKSELKKEYPGGCERIALAGNVDGYIMQRIKREVLNKCKGETIFVVISDGNPHVDFGDDYYIADTDYQKKWSDYDLKKEVDELVKRNVKFISVGIQSQEIKKYYPEETCYIIDDVDGLYAPLAKELNKLILRK